MWPFSSENVWLGYSLAEMAAIRSALETAGIRYRIKVTDHAGQWNGKRGTFRSVSGSVGSNPAYEKQHEILVREGDVTHARTLAKTALENASHT